MNCIRRIGLIVGLAVLAADLVWADEPSAPAAVRGHHVCLDQKERRAAIESGKAIRLAEAMRAARHRVPGTIVRAQLCRNGEQLTYVLTVLAHDGKVVRLSVDAVKGTLVGLR